jgi:hypothetical protein
MRLIARGLDDNYCKIPIALLDPPTGGFECEHLIEQAGSQLQPGLQNLCQRARMSR